MNDPKNNNDNINYPYEKQKIWINEISNEYSSLFLYKNLKNCLPKTELSQYNKEIIKESLAVLSKKQESNFIKIIESSNKKVNMDKITKELFEINEEKEIMKEIGVNEKESIDKEEGDDWIDKRMLNCMNEFLIKNSQELHFSHNL